MNEQVKVEITRQDHAPDAVAYQARINGAAFPVETFGVEPGEDGRVLVSLVVAVSSLQIGEPDTDAMPATDEDNLSRSTWGDPGVPDPRETIPGWSRPVSADVARACQEPATGTVTFKPDQVAGDKLVAAIRDTIRVRYNGDVQAALR